MKVLGHSMKFLKDFEFSEDEIATFKKIYRQILKQRQKRKPNNVKYVLLRRKILMVKVSAALNCDPSLMSNYVNGRRKIPVAMKKRLSDYLEIPPEILFAESPEEYFKFALKAGQRLPEQP